MLCDELPLDVFHTVDKKVVKGKPAGKKTAPKSSKQQKKISSGTVDNETGGSEQEDVAVVMFPAVERPREEVIVGNDNKDTVEPVVYEVPDVVDEPAVEEVILEDEEDVPEDVPDVIAETVPEIIPIPEVIHVPEEILEITEESVPEVTLVAEEPVLEVPEAVGEYAVHELNPAAAEFVPEDILDAERPPETVTPEIEDEIVEIPDEAEPVVIADDVEELVGGDVSFENDPVPLEDLSVVEVPLSDPDETYPYEDPDAIKFYETWFEEEDLESGGEVESVTSEGNTSVEETPIRRSTRSRFPKLLSTFDKLGGKMVFTPVGKK